VSIRWLQFASFIILTGASAGPTLPASLTRFVDALPIPPRIQAEGHPADLTVTIDQFQTKIHRDLPAVTEWGYDGSSPGPTIEVERGQQLTVHWQSRLPVTHLFPAPAGADQVWPDVRSVTHLHGAAVLESDPMDRTQNNDGWPDNTIVPGEEQLAEYPNDQTARLLWYHDHAMGETGRNVAAGLEGLYEIHDDYERSLNLPAGPYEIPLLLSTKQVNADGTLGYSDDISKEFWGNAAAVNGKLWPYLKVEPRKYRFRIVNAANARSFSLKLVDDQSRKPGPAFYQIGTGSGFLEKTAILDDPSSPSAPRLILAPAERADVIIDFSAVAGHTFTLTNNAYDQSDDEVSLPKIMQFRVAATASTSDTSSLPLTMQPIPRLDPAAAKAARQIVFDTMKMPDGSDMLLLNGKRWHDPIAERPVLGTTEVWDLVNPLIATHPFHIHMVQFQVLDRRLFDASAYIKTGKITYLADAVPPAPNEMGWKDTVRALPQMVTRIIIRFGPYPGYYVYHCHILEHEDMDMMRPFQVVAAPESDSADNSQ